MSATPSDAPAAAGCQSPSSPSPAPQAQQPISQPDEVASLLHWAGRDADRRCNLYCQHSGATDARGAKRPVEGARQLPDYETKLTITEMQETLNCFYSAFSQFPEASYVRMDSIEHVCTPACIYWIHRGVYVCMDSGDFHLCSATTCDSCIDQTPKEQESAPVGAKRKSCPVSLRMNHWEQHDYCHDCIRNREKLRLANRICRVTGNVYDLHLEQTFEEDGVGNDGKNWPGAIELGDPGRDFRPSDFDDLDAAFEEIEQTRTVKKVKLTHHVPVVQAIVDQDEVELMEIEQKMMAVGITPDDFMDEFGPCANEILLIHKKTAARTKLTLQQLVVVVLDRTSTGALWVPGQSVPAIKGRAKLFKGKVLALTVIEKAQLKEMRVRLTNALLALGSLWGKALPAAFRQ